MMPCFRCTTNCVVVVDIRERHGPRNPDEMKLIEKIRVAADKSMCKLDETLAKLPYTADRQ